MQNKNYHNQESCKKKNKIEGSLLNVKQVSHLKPVAFNYFIQMRTPKMGQKSQLPKTAIHLP